MNKDLLESIYGLGKHIALIKSATGWRVISLFDTNTWNYWEIKLIHKKHESILDAYLKDNDVEIIKKLVDKKTSLNDFDFINSYCEDCEYKLKETPQEYITVPGRDKKFLKPEGFDVELFFTDKHEDVFGLVGTEALFWNPNGNCHYIGDDEVGEESKYNLTPYIEPKPWYKKHTNFPTIVTDGVYYQVAYDVDEEKNMILCQDGVRLNLDTWRTLLDEEIDDLKIDKH